jgi:hypothetical protein
LVDAASGLPIAPVGQSLSDEQGYRSTFNDELQAYQPHLDTLTTDIAHIEALNLDKKMVHIIDREGDSIAHLRKLSMQNVNWLIRGKEGHLVDYQGISQKLGQVADRLTDPVSRQVAYKGKTARLSVSETLLTLTRAAAAKRLDEKTGKRVKRQSGESLSVRLVVAHLSDSQGKCLARWTLLTNVAGDISKEEIAQWYYWRWNIESFFKLIKGAGHDLEGWLQRSADAVFRRLLIVSQACVMVWRLQRETSEPGVRARQFLCRLSGRQQKRGQRESAPALLAGLSILLNTLQLLSEYSVEELNQFKIAAFAQNRDV